MPGEVGPGSCVVPSRGGGNVSNGGRVPINQFNYGCVVVDVWWGEGSGGLLFN